MGISGKPSRILRAEGVWEEKCLDSERKVRGTTNERLVLGFARSRSPTNEQADAPDGEKREASWLRHGIEQG